MFQAGIPQSRLVTQVEILRKNTVFELRKNQQLHKNAQQKLKQLAPSHPPKTTLVPPPPLSPEHKQHLKLDLTKNCTHSFHSRNQLVCKRRSVKIRRSEYDVPTKKQRWWCEAVVKWSVQLYSTVTICKLKQYKDVLNTLIILLQ